MTLREQILALNDRIRVKVYVPEWKLSLYCVPMSAARNVEYAAAIKEYPDDPNNALLVVYCTEDEEGKPVFNTDDVPALAAKSSAALKRLAVIISDMHPSMEDCRKNLPAPL